jgi:HK97 family phage major capsid protein
VKQLVAKRNELKEKQKELAEVFEQAGPEMDLDKVTKLGDGLTTAQKAAKIREKNTELTDLGKQVEELIGVETAAADVKAREALLEKGVIVHPGAKPGESGDDGRLERAIQKTLGDMFVESDAFKKFRSVEKRGPSVEINLGDPRKGGIELKTLLTTTGFAPEATRQGPILPTALRRPVVADLIPQGTTDKNAIKFMEETTATNAAAAVAEGADKPESTLAFTERVSPVQKLATVLPVTDELMEDEAAMRSYVEARLRLFLQLAEETALVGGSGTPPALRGMLNIVGIQTQAKGADPTPDAVYKAMTKIRVVGFLEPTGAIFHPNDWTDVRLLRTVDGIYIWGSPADPGPERIWGMPIVQTPAMTEGTGIVAAFDTSMQIFRRNQVAFAVSDQHNDFFIKNQLMLRVEERLAFVVYRPTGICTVTGI